MIWTCKIPNCRKLMHFVRHCAHCGKPTLTHENFTPGVISTFCGIECVLPNITHGEAQRRLRMRLRGEITK